MHRMQPLARARLATLLVVLVAALPLSCGGGGGGEGTPEPVFFVSSSYPADGQQAVPVDAIVTVTCNMPLDPATVNWQSLRVGVIGGAGEVPGQAALDLQNTRTIRWTPNGQMFPVASHALEISAGLRSEDGDAIEGDLTVTFRTGAELPGPGLPEREDLTELQNTLNIGRRQHTATLLESGFVLIAGGFRQGTNVTDRAELYLGGTFLLLDEAMVQERAGHTATRLADGRVLLAGGWYEQGIGQLVSTNSAEIYDPSTASFAAVGPMTSDRVDHAAILLTDGRVLITGGSRYVAANWFDLDTAEVFDPVTGTFTELDSRMTTIRWAHVMEDMGNGEIFVHGGSFTDVRPDLFDPTTDEFTPTLAAYQDASRFGAASATFEDGDVCVAGGEALGTVLHVDAGTGWVALTGSGLNAPRAYATATRYAPDRILVVGGYDFSGSATMLLATTDVVIQGGITGSRTYGCEMRFPTGMVGHTATRLLDGTIFFCGGTNANGGEPELSAAYVFTPQ